MSFTWCWRCWQGDFYESAGWYIDRNFYPKRENDIFTLLCYYWNKIEYLLTTKTLVLVHTITRYSQIQNNWGPPTAIRLSIELEFFGVISIWQALKCHWNLNSLVLRRILCETYKCSCCLGIKKVSYSEIPEQQNQICKSFFSVFIRFDR